MVQKDSSEVSWKLVVEGAVVVESGEIMDCIEARDEHNGRITDSFQG